MDWITFMEKKRSELMNTGHIMDYETFITHLLNSLPQSEYMGAILVIKTSSEKDLWKSQKLSKFWRIDVKQ